LSFDKFKECYHDGAWAFPLPSPFSEPLASHVVVLHDVAGDDIRIETAINFAELKTDDHRSSSVMNTRELDPHPRILLQ
jgi:hypothetical protein